MSSIEDRQSSTIPGQAPKTGTLPRHGSQQSPVEQMSFPVTTIQPNEAPHLSNFQYSPGITRPLVNPSTSPDETGPLSDPTTSPGATRKLLELQTGALLPLRSTTSALRPPVVIRSTGKKSRGTMRPPRGRRWVVHLSATLLLVFIAIGALMAVAPAGISGETGFNSFRPIVNWAQGDNSNLNLLAQQAATVTAVTRDGYEPGNTTQINFPGLPTPPPSIAGSGSGDTFTYGQCTYWASLRYHQMTGFWVPWRGDAWAWAGGAQQSGWIVSGSPHVPSIIVLQPWVQGAGGFGHVAVVERINPDGSVYTSNWNWYAGGGGWARTSYWTFHPGPGVSFVWHP